jgi:branched-chain amino acid transport system ATP-binding protein
MTCSRAIPTSWKPIWGPPIPDGLFPRLSGLVVRDLHAWYGESHVLHGMSFDVRPDEVVTLLGRNGAGKTSTLRSIMGIAPTRRGSVIFEGDELIDLPSNQIARRGIAFCPEERAIFASLNVAENLELPPIVRQGGMSTADVYALFPSLYERRISQGTKLSGGEQQMLAISRILRMGAPLLLLDEPIEGLAPTIVRQMGQAIMALKVKGCTVLLVEQNFHFAATPADRHYIVEASSSADAWLINSTEIRSQRAVTSSISTSASRRKSATDGLRHFVPGPVRSTADRPDQWRLLCADEPRHRNHIWHVAHRQLRAGCAIHAWRVRRVVPLEPAATLSRSRSAVNRLLARPGHRAPGGRRARLRDGEAFYKPRLQSRTRLWRVVDAWPLPGDLPRSVRLARQTL